jgi:predicted Zn finger-like uncharacterized protein
MNVTCTGCPAKYAVPDDKVRGKKVRITCKHCGTNIIVDGTVDTAAHGPSHAAASLPKSAPNTSHAPAKAAEAKKAAQPKPAAEVMYIVGFADDRQHPHTVAQIVELYSAGKIDDEALVWKDGMADWLSPFDVPELAAAFRAKNVAPRAPGAAFAAAEDEATLVVRSPFEDPAFAASVGKAPVPVAKAPVVAAPVATAPVAMAPVATAPVAAAPVAAAPVAAAPVAAAPVAPAAPEAEPAEEPLVEKPAAARRIEKRAGAVDLFSRHAETGSEGDVSLDLGEERAHKLTGARNESSVLFSLDALTKSEPKANKAKEKEKEKEQERETEALFGESTADPLLNLGGAGLGALAAPDFTKPVSKVVQPVPSGNPLEAPTATASKGRGGVVLLVGFLGIAAAAAVAFVMMKKQPTADIVPTAPSAATQVRASAEPNAGDSPSPSAAPAGSVEPAASAAASAVPAASASSAAPTGSTEALAAASAKAIAPATPATPAVANKPAEPVAAAKAPAAEAPAAAAPAAAAAAAPAAAAATPEGAAFDKNAAVAALGAAAANAASCKKPDGPGGSGKVSVTFAPSGRATATSVAGDLAGTEVGGCVARIFRAAKVPPFSGDPVTVSKSFTVQ